MSCQSTYILQEFLSLEKRVSWKAGGVGVVVVYYFEGSFALWRQNEGRPVVVIYTIDHINDGTIIYRWLGLNMAFTGVSPDQKQQQLRNESQTLPWKNLIKAKKGQREI